jgi:hypothetical protein
MLLMVKGMQQLQRECSSSWGMPDRIQALFMLLGQRIQAFLHWECGPFGAFRECPAGQPVAVSIAKIETEEAYTLIERRIYDNAS